MRAFPAVCRTGSSLVSLVVLAGVSIAATGQAIDVRSENFEIRFAPENASPQQWSISGPRPDDVDRVQLIDPAMPLPFIVGHWLSNSGSATNIGDRTTVEWTVDGEDQVVRFRNTDPQVGLEATWSYRLPPRGFVAELTVTIASSDENPAALDGSVRWSFGPGLGHLDENRTTRGAVMRAAGAFANLDLPSAEATRDPTAGSTSLTGPFSWIALHGRYYLFAVIGDPELPLDEDVQLSVEKLQESGLLEPDPLPDDPRIVLRSPPLSIEPGGAFTRSFRLFLGPKDRRLMSQEGVGLEKTIFGHLPGWFSQICLGIYYLLAALHSLLKSWGISIILMAIAVRICVFPLSSYSLRAQANFSRKQKQAKPLLAEVRSIYEGSAAKINEETLKIYKKIGLRPLDPLKGMLPLLIQLPILFAFYQLLSTSYDLKGVPFLWIDDLTLPDGLSSLGFSLPWLGDTVNLLPILMFVAHVTIARDLDANEHAGDRSHQASPTIYLFPLLMLLLFYPFPAGCMLYWTVGSILQVFEQRWCRASMLE